MKCYTRIIVRNAIGSDNIYCVEVFHNEISSGKGGFTSEPDAFNWAIDELKRIKGGD
jgi:hypothetical protein